MKSARVSAGRALVPDLFEERSAAAVRIDQTVSLKLTPEQLAQFESLMEALRKQGLKGSREEVLLAALDQAADCTGLLGKRSRSPSATCESASRSARRGRKRYTRVQSSPKQIVLYQCEDCGKTSVQTRRGALPMSAGAAEQARCDAQVLGKDGINRATIPPAKRKRVFARDRHQCQSPGCGNTRFLEVHHIKPRSKGGTNHEGNLTTLCSACHRLEHSGRVADSGNPLAGCEFPEPVCL